MDEKLWAVAKSTWDEAVEYRFTEDWKGYYDKAHANRKQILAAIELVEAEIRRRFDAMKTL